ncbi:hypothetical protein [Methylobacterium sp. P1-11]|uniref:hypothetical protein n=1 Tax=Methylobacterium sp. P1-11 TaxID=2024616 RepID=UPI001FEE32C1|nr:hypothetical protein [Methylobacterium sp. P1-11]
MPPDAPYPAAIDDATAVWRAMKTRQKPQNVAVRHLYGWRHDPVPDAPGEGRGLALQAPIGLGTPWSDMTETGDGYRTNEWLDNVLSAIPATSRRPPSSTLPVGT